MKADPGRAEMTSILLSFRNENSRVKEFSKFPSLDEGLKKKDHGATTLRLSVTSQKRNLAVFPTAICG